MDEKSNVLNIKIFLHDYSLNHVLKDYQPYKGKKYDLSFLNDYVVLNGISKDELAIYIGVSRAQIYRILNGEHLINDIRLNKILTLFNVDSYEELKLFVENDIKLYNASLEENDFDIAYLKYFLKQNKISNITFTKYLGISKAHLYRLFNGELAIKDKYIHKILDLFNSEEIANELSRKKTKINNEPGTRKIRYDISFLKNYLKEHHITQVELANYLEVSQQYISTFLNGQDLVNQDYLNKLLLYFNVDSYDELYELTNDEDIKILKKTSI